MELIIFPVPLNEVHIPRRSLKDHPERQIEQIVNSIQTFGFNDPIAIDEQGQIIEGTGRVLAARKLGIDMIPAIRLLHLDKAQKKAYRIAHNKITLNTGFDLDALREEFEALSKLDESLMTFIGFETAELADLLKMPEMPDLAPELTETLKDLKTVTCPHCGGQVHV